MEEPEVRFKLKDTLTTRRSNNEKAKTEEKLGHYFDLVKDKGVVFPEISIDIPLVGGDV